MGVTRFHVPQPDRLPTDAVRQCYMQGIEAVPWQSKNVFKGELLTVQRSTSESGSLFVPWPVPGRGRMTLSTTCLRETDRSYHLPVELARGTVGKLRNQIGLWQQNGVPVSDEVIQRVRSATRALSRAATSQQDVRASSKAAQDAIGESLDAIDLMMLAFSTYTLSQSGKRNVFLGANLGSRSGHKFPSELLGAIDTAVVPFSWSEVEGNSEYNADDYFAEQIRWSRTLGLRVCGGPLLNFDKNGLPDWLYLWEEDTEALQSYMLRYIETIVKRFVGKVNLWHAWAGLNNGQAMNLGEEFRMRIGVAAIETLREHDPTTPVFVSFSQPFGEYLSRQALDLAPIHYADTLVRADLGVAGFGLEINLGYWPDGTLPRDVLEVSRLIERWSALGLPLIMILTLPSETSSTEDAGTIPFGTDEFTQADQARLAAEMIRICLAKSAVQGVIWNQLMDGDSAIYTNAGLFSSDGSAKPILLGLKEIRERHLI